MQWIERHWLCFAWSVTWSTYTELFGDPDLYFGAAVTHRAEIAADSCGRHLAQSFLRSRGSMTPITTCLQRIAHNYEDIIYKDGRRGTQSRLRCRRGNTRRLLVFLTPDCFVGHEGDKCQVRKPVSPSRSLSKHAALSLDRIPLRWLIHIINKASAPNGDASDQSVVKIGEMFHHPAVSRPLCRSLSFVSLNRVC